MCTCVGNIEATYSKQAKKNIKIKMQREILLVKSASKNYKCSSRLHILQQQQKYVHTKILFSVLYTESQNKLFFFCCCCCIVVRSWQKFYNREWILYILYFRFAGTFIESENRFSSHKTTENENENENMCAACAKMCAFVHFSHVFFVVGKICSYKEGWEKGKFSGKCTKWTSFL